jgi:DnaJ-class molecular chaperone
MADKAWGDEPFWGLGYDWDPDWVLTERQKELLRELEESSRDNSAKHNPRSKSWMDKVKDFFAE